MNLYVGNLPANAAIPALDKRFDHNFAQNYGVSIRLVQKVRISIRQMGCNRLKFEVINKLRLS